MTAPDSPLHIYEGCTMASTLTEPPMEAEALFIHTCNLLRDAPARIYDPGIAPWYQETPRDWFRVSRWKT